MNQNEPAGTPITERRRVGWWGRNPDYSWDDQGCLGCGLAWWFAAMFAILAFEFWGWGYPGYGGWGGWGWRYRPTAAYNYNCPPTTGANVPTGRGAPVVQPGASSGSVNWNTGYGGDAGAPQQR